MYIHCARLRTSCLLAALTLAGAAFAGPSGANDAASAPARSAPAVPAALRGRLVATDAQGRVISSVRTSNGKHIRIAVNDSDAAYPLTVDPLVWLEQKVLANDGAEGDGFGGAIAIAGSTALIGAPGAAIDGQESVGVAYVFTYSGGLWSEQQKLVASDGTLFVGMSVALDG